LEEREQTLSRRIADMEPKAEKAERTLSALKGETRKLEDIGFSLRDLTEFNEKLQEIAQDQAIKPSELRSRLLRELQTLDKGLTLETLIQSRQQELDKAEQAHVSAKKEVETTMAVVDSLGQEKTNLEESIKEMRNKVMREIAKIVPLARDAVVKFVEDLQHGNDEALAEVQRLKDEAIEIGREVGQYEGILKSCEWLDELLILVEGEENIADKRVKVIALLVVRAIHTWMKRQESISYALLQHALETLIGELDRWKV
jgi:chromosome segregation ATPase